MASPANGVGPTQHISSPSAPAQSPASQPHPPSSAAAAAAIQQGFQANASQHLAAHPFRAPGSGQGNAGPSTLSSSNQNASSSSNSNANSWVAAGGIDLRAEEEALRAGERQAPPPSDPYSNSTQRGQTGAIASSSASSSSSSTGYLQLLPLAQMVHRTSSSYDINDVDPEVLNILSAGARVRFRNLLEGMVRAARHRGWSDAEREPPLEEGNRGKKDGKQKEKRPLYHEELLSDPSKWLRALEKAERGQEAVMRRKRAQLRAERERREAERAAGVSTPLASKDGANDDSTMDGGAGDDTEEGGSSRKKAKLATNASSSANGGGGSASAPGSGDGTGPSTPAAAPPASTTTASMSAKNMSDDVRRRLANNTAARALGSLGGSMPKWMTMGGGAGAGAGGGGFGSVGGEGGMSPASNLPKPRFAPQPPAQQQEGNQAGWARAPSGKAGSPIAGEGTVNPQGWGDLSLRALAKQEEERKKRKRVLLSDAFHALEMERRNGGGGSSGGDRVVMRWRALGGKEGKEGQEQ